MSKVKSDIKIDVVSSKYLLRAFNDGLEAYYSDLSGLSCPEPTLAQQQFADDSDPNTIISKFAKTGDINLLSGNTRMPRYGDFTNVTDYQSSLNLVIAAQEAFMSLDAKLRARFDNDPGKFLEFVEDPANQDELVKLGLAEAMPEKREPHNAGESGIADNNPPAAPKE